MDEPTESVTTSPSGPQRGEVALEAVGITKRYGSVLACDAVDFQALSGEIHGVLGQNGAGKTTLMNVLLGLVRPDGGRIRMRGETVEMTDPITAGEMGVAMVHQHFSLIDAHTVWENVTLGERGRVNPRKARARIEETGRRYGLAVDPMARVRDLTMGQRQRVEILKCLLRQPQVLILDEPTSVLTSNESFELFSILRHVVKEENRAVVLVSHKLDEILFATDQVTIMRNGAVVARLATAQTDAQHLAREMIGRDVDLGRGSAALGHFDGGLVGRLPTGRLPTGQLPTGQLPTGPGVASEASPVAGPVADAPTEAPIGAAAGEGDSDVVLEITDACAVASDGRPLLNGFSLRLRRGEIVGLAGVEGNGQHAVGELLSSLLHLDSGTVTVAGKPVAAGHPGGMHAAGVGVIPEDRHRSGCVLDLSVAENLTLGSWDAIVNRGFISRQRLRTVARRLVEEFDIAVASVDAPMRSLSGGNQQKVVLARELVANPTVLVAAQPTRGLDVGAIEYMNGRLRQARAEGRGVLLISTELEEILALADRIAVIHRGRIVGEMDCRDVDLARIGMLMGGQAA